MSYARLPIEITQNGGHHYRQIWLQHREENLRSDLFLLRHAIDQYAVDKRELPRSLDDLVDEQYLSNVPVDPILYRQTWKIVIGNDPNSVNTRHGIVDVHSFSTEVSTNGTPYNEW